MSPIVVFLLGAYIGACFGACVMLAWWYRCDSIEHGTRSNQRGAQR
jgi:hypothetical protein